MIEILKLNPPGVIKLDDIHPHWRYQKPQVTAEGLEEVVEALENVDPLLRVRDPAVVRTKGRPAGSGNKRKTAEHERSTHRDLSGFEHADREFDAATQSQITQSQAIQSQATQSQATQSQRPAKRRQRGRPRAQGDEEVEGSQVMEGGGLMTVFRM